MLRFLNRFIKLKKDKVFARNYAVFSFVLVLSASALIYVLVSGERTIAKSGDQVTRTYEIIGHAQDLSVLVEGMLASQRAFVITREDRFLEKYRSRRDRVSEIIANLTELMSGNKSQTSRLDELRHHFNAFSVDLEQRAQTFTITNAAKIILDDVETIDGIQNNIMRINDAILREEYRVLNEKIDEIEQKKSRYFITLLIGVVVTSALLLLLNGFLLRAQRRRSRIEASLKDSEKRFALAIEGTQDGIFDWNILTGDVFYSRRFFDMLGYDRDAFIGKIEDFKTLLHPEDAARAWSYLEKYLEKGTSEYYDQTFRLKSQNGTWVWISASAKAIFDDEDRPVRMVGAHTDITDIKQYEERLKSEKMQAEEANRAKSDFLAHMSHEIRTPLTAISGIAEIFEKNQDNLDGKQKKLTRTLHSSVSILKDLINDILDFSKIESGELELDEEDFHLSALFEEIADMMGVRAGDRGVSFIFDYGEVKGSLFHGDEARLRQILINLIGNALKFTEEGGVTVKAYKENREGVIFLRIDVADTGIGISPENFDLVFERFKQADSSVSRKYGGTGLGLPISKNLARLMGGDIILSSELGKGSTFSVLVPMKISGDEDGEVSRKELNKQLSDQIKTALKDQSQILLVEDYEGNVVVLSYILDDLGFDYAVAKTGKEALEMWEKAQYDIILMDIQMPEMDGFAATKAIRKQEKQQNRPRTPIIGMTAHALVGDKDKCIEAGMDSYLPKPIVETDLKKEILKYLGREEQKKVA